MSNELHAGAPESGPSDDPTSKPAKGMGVEGTMFLSLTVFFFTAAILYGIWSKGESVGTVGFILSGGLTLIIGSFLIFTGRRLDEPRPEDRDNAEIADGAGDLGFFSPGSYWPVTLAASAALFAIATAFLLVWLMIIGAAFLLLSVAGLLFEYHRRPASH